MSLISVLTYWCYLVRFLRKKKILTHYRVGTLGQGGLSFAKIINCYVKCLTLPITIVEEVSITDLNKFFFFAFFSLVCFWRKKCEQRHISQEDKSEKLGLGTRTQLTQGGS